MKKLATILLSTALVGGLTLTTFASTASAQDSYRGGQRGNFAAQQQQDPGQNMRGPGVWSQNMQVSGQRGAGIGMARGGLVSFVCSENGAPRAEIMLNNLSGNLTLDDDQTALFDAFKTSVLTAQTTFADTCETPVIAEGETPNPVDMLELRVTNETAQIAAIESVLPSLEAFYNSLTDEQKTELLPARRGDMRVGQGWFAPGKSQQGQGFGPRGMGPGQGNFGPSQNIGPGQGFGPNQGQGFGPRNNG